MSTAEFTAGSAGSTAVRTSADLAEASRSRWMWLWRVHIYAGLFAIPFILLMATTGLVILYTQPIQDTLQGDLRTVAEVGDTPVGLEAQLDAVRTAHPDYAITAVTVPVGDRHSTRFDADDAGTPRHVFVDPYTAEVLGDTDPDGDIVGLANRLHGHLNNDAVTVGLPTVSALWDGGEVMRDYVVGDLVLELLGVWTFVLIASGLYLRWPRRTREGAGWRRFFGLEVAKKGRARWRDLHGISGVAMTVMLLITLVSGLAWSTYWGPHVTSIANAISPNVWTDAPPSGAGTRGDLDRLGNQTNWNTHDQHLPASGGVAAGEDAPAPIGLDSIAAIAEEEGMLPGWTAFLPSNSEGADGEIVHGSVTVSNSWPRKTGEARDLYLDQFTGETLGGQDVYGYGTVSRGLDTLVSTHMGTQLGIASRILMTALCIFAIWSVVTALMMFRKRRAPGSTGLPARRTQAKPTRSVGLFALALGLAFPQWAVSALAVLGLDRAVSSLRARRAA